MDQPPPPPSEESEEIEAGEARSEPSSEEKTYTPASREWLEKWEREANAAGIITRPAEPGSEPVPEIATGHERWKLCCGNKRCNTVKFSIIRDQPEKGPFMWQEVIVTMCENGEMAPVLNRLATSNMRTGRAIYD